jgi:hypothetical protein
MALLAGVVSDSAFVIDTFINDDSQHAVEGVILLVCWYLVI